MIALALSLLVSAGPVVPLGTFDNYRFTEEHQYGYGVRLWRQGDRLYGTFGAANGLAGDTPAGLITKGRYASEGSDVSFAVELVTGSHFCKVHRAVPARSGYSFRGRLAGGRLSGTIEVTETLHPEKAVEREPVALASRAEPALGTYATREEWESAARNTWAVQPLPTR